MVGCDASRLPRRRSDPGVAFAVTLQRVGRPRDFLHIDEIKLMQDILKSDIHEWRSKAMKF